MLALTKALLKPHKQLYYLVLKKICIRRHIKCCNSLLTNYFSLIIMITKCCNLIMYYIPRCCKLD